MKRLLLILIIIFLLCLLISIFSRPIIIFLAKEQLENVFEQAQVYIGGYSLKPTHLFKLFNIEIKRENAYEFRVKELGVYYSLFSILKRNILKFSIKDAVIKMAIPKKDILAFNQYLNLRPGGIFVIRDVEVQDVHLEVNSRDWELKADISAGINAVEQLINYLDLDIASLKNRDLSLEDASLTLRQKQDAGNFYIRRIQYNKSSLEELKAKANLNDSLLRLSEVSAQYLGGQLRGEARFNLDQNFDYDLNLKFTNVDLERFIDAFEIENKVQLSGRLVGQARLTGKNMRIDALEGNLSAVHPGGMLNIKDKQVLENMAGATEQNINIIMESFQNYRYNEGSAKLTLDNDNIVVDIVLDGEAGKRSLHITLHDFK